MIQKYATGSRVRTISDDRICRDLWNKAGTIEGFHQPCPESEFRRAGEWLYIVKFDDPKREAREDMPILQCEEWTIVPL